MKNPSPNAIFSPARIKVLLHCHAIATPVPCLGGEDENELARETVDWLLSLDAITPDESIPNRYVTTARGQAWVEALCRVEAPRATYVDRDGTVLL